MRITSLHICSYVLFAPSVANLPLRGGDIPLSAFALRAHEGDKGALLAIQQETAETHSCPPRKPLVGERTEGDVAPAQPEKGDRGSNQTGGKMN